MLTSRKIRQPTIEMRSVMRCRQARRKISIREKKRSPRVGLDQKRALISYCEKHTLFARGQVTKIGSGGNLKRHAMWKKLAVTLNKIGPAKKNGKEWMKYWTTMRRDGRLRSVKYLKAFNKTGHNKPSIKVADEDLRIAQIFGQPGLGLEVYPECGFSFV
ncbi:hypothetical protein QAD02_008457 [Eretmocerus hayati]|uniref:Uncharacterized protein n=1 Tax=Eretmocerus hayati TaxID=131215 RepID=A0ACC2NAY9_9HYME|nr:hypothetical protein QAD02_008457 [Eretmocerus hayati]